MITVKVVGLAGEGKSTIAALIKKALEDSGIGVEFADTNGTDYDEGLFDAERLKLTVAAMTKRHALVNVETVQLPRSAYRKQKR